jgi:hypothetical protein
LISGPSSNNPQAPPRKRGFVGIHRTEDVAPEISRLEKVIAEGEMQEFPCAYDVFSDTPLCFNNCVPECMGAISHLAERGLCNLRARSCLKFAFANPDHGAVNVLLGFEQLKYSHEFEWR